MATSAELFRPFEQRGADRSGMGLGLAFSRWEAEANGGRIYARNLPGKNAFLTSTCRGCQFLPVEVVQS
jgi:C4-dicarboxylate-specific signal transduction histidine kinase